MIDIGGIVLLIISLAGAIKGLALPIVIPEILTLLSLGLLIYQGAFKRSRLMFIHSAAFWLALTWIAGDYLKSSLQLGIIAQIITGMLLVVTPLAAIAPVMLHRRFTPTTGKKLELTRTEVSPMQEFKKSISSLKLKKQTTNDEKKQITIEQITFDLGEEILFENK